MLKRLTCSFTTFILLIGFTLTPLTSAKATEQAEVTKPVSFAILEDYDKGTDLSNVALDFQLMNQLGIDEMRCSFGWDDYEPSPGHYDFIWLKQFVALAQSYGIKLRPYVAYTAPWAGMHGTDGIYWNDPPRSLPRWYEFVHHLAAALKGYPNILSYEFYNEENDSFWWEGTNDEYGKTLRTAARAVHEAAPGTQVILGGLVFPDFDWLQGLVDGGYADSWDITPFHAYPETWEDVAVESYLDVQYYNYFVPENRRAGNKPIWVNEMGFATTKGKTDREQADWFARAVSTFLADPYIQECGIYEIKDLPIDDPAIGGDPNYHLGITHVSRRKKLAFWTVQMLSNLLNVGKITTADGEAEVTITSGQSRELYDHLFKRTDGSQVLFVYDKTSNPTVQVRLQEPGKGATLYRLDGTSHPYRDFDGRTISNIALTPGNVSIFLIR